MTEQSPEELFEFEAEGLSPFNQNNPHISCRREGKLTVFDNPWGAKNVAIFCEINEKDFLSDLNNVWFHSAFDAIIHLDTSTIEFIFGFLNPLNDVSASYIDRVFNIYFQGNEFKCSFSEPTRRFMDIAKRTGTVPSDDAGQTVPQLPAFRDYQKLDALPERAKKYFEGKVPRNFHVTSNCDVTKIDLITLAKHINFIVGYFDRSSPFITIREKEHNETKKRHYDT